MPGPGGRGGVNQGGVKTPEQLAYDQAIKDAMMAEALRTNQPTNQQGMMQTNTTTPSSVQENPSNLTSARETTGNGNGLFSGMSNLEMANLLESQGLLGTPEGMLLNRHQETNLLDRYNNFQVNNFDPTSFDSFEDAYTWLDGLDLNLDRTTFKGGRGGGPGTTADDTANQELKGSTHEFVNASANAAGMPLVKQEGNKIYVLNTGYGSNLPDLGQYEDGSQIKFAGSGGFYHKIGPDAERGEYQVYEPQNKQGPDTDMLSDQIMPVVKQIAISAAFAAMAAPVGAAIGGTTAGAAAGTVVPTLGANLVTGALTGAGTTAFNQVASGQGLDLTDIAIGGLKGGVGGAATGMISDYAAYAGGGFETGAIEGAGNAFVSGALEGEFDLESIAIGGLVGGSIQALKDGFDDLFQTDDLRDLTKQELGKPEWNSLDLTDAQLAGLSPAQLTDYMNKRTSFEDHVVELYRTTDFGKLFGEEGLLNKMGFDTEYISTAPVVEALEFLATPLNAISEFMGGEAFYAPSAAGDKWDENFVAKWDAVKNDLYAVTFDDTYGLTPEAASQLEAEKTSALNAANEIDKYLGFNPLTGEYENSDFDLVGLAQSGASNEDLDFFRNVNYIDPDNPDHRGNTEAQNWVNEDLGRLDAGLITEEDVLTSLNNAADYNYQQNVRYDERFSAWAPRDNALPWTHIQETDTFSGSRPGRIDTLKDKVASIPTEAANFIGDVEAMLTAGPETWSDAINIVTDAYDAWESGASALSEGTDFGNYIEQNLQASNTPNELYANLGVDPELTEGSLEIDPELTEGSLGGGNVVPSGTDPEYPEDVLPSGPTPTGPTPTGPTGPPDGTRGPGGTSPTTNPEPSETELPTNPEPSGTELPTNPEPSGTELPTNPEPEDELKGGGGGGDDALPKGDDPTLQQKAIQDDYMIDKELYRLARITQVISLSEGDLASIQKRMAVLREQKEAIAGDIVGAVQKKSGKYIKQTYEEEGRRKRTREDNIVENPELYTT